MKTSTTILALIALIFGAQVALAQQVIEVQAEQNAVLDAYDMAQPGDIIELVDCGATYNNDDRLQNEIPLTVRGAEQCADDNRPILYNNSGESTKDIFRVWDDLTIRNVEVYGGPVPDSTLKYAIRTDYEEGDANRTKDGYVLKVFDSYFLDIVDGGDGNVLRAYPGAYADSIIFKNVTIENTGKQAIRVDMTSGYDYVPGISPNSYGVGYFEASNVTISDTRNEAIAIWGGDDDYTTEGPEVVIDHLTCDNCGYEGSRALYPYHVNNTTITNVLLTNSPGNDDVVKLYGPDAFINYADTLNVGGEIATDGGAQIGEEIYSVDPLYVAPEENNFELQENSPVLNMGSDGLALGDLRNANQQVAIDEVGGEIPTELALNQNLPNPFRLSTQIPFKLDGVTHAVITVYDVLGREVATVVDKKLSAGSYEATFDASTLTSGIYFYVLEADGRTATRRMTVVK